MDPQSFDWNALEVATRAWVRNSPQARAVVQLIADCLHRALVLPPAASDATPALPETQGQQPLQPVLAPLDVLGPLSEALRPRLATEVVAHTGAARPNVPIELSVVARRSRLKAEAFRWAVERRRRTLDGTWTRDDIDAGYRELIGKAKQLPDCYLWMLAPDRWLPSDAQIEEIVAAFDNLALAIEIELSVATDEKSVGDVAEDIMCLLAECQSALRAALLDLSDPYEDRDQLQAHMWLRDATRERQVFIARYMRVEDPASPHDWYERAKRLAAFQDRFANSQRAERERTQGLNKLRYHARRISNAPDDANLTSDWKTVFETIDKLLALGVKPSSKELRDLVLPIVERVPEGSAASAGWALVDRHIDEYLALLEAEPVAAPAVRSRSRDVEQAAELLRGRHVVLIGGTERPRSKEALIRDLELSGLTWITSKEHESLDRFEPIVTDPKVDVVILMIRWSSHSYGGVKKFCDEHGKLMVRLPGGYSPNQVAMQVLQQIGERLKRMHSPGP